MTESSQGSLREIGSGGIWVRERDVWFSGVRLRSRMSVFRLADGKLWVHSTSGPTESLCAELDRLGEVAWLIVPNRWHHLQANAMKARYPRAQVVAPTSARVRNPTLPLDLAIDDARLPSLVPELAPIPLAGVPFLDETLFLHQPTQTLIGADVMMCGCPADHFTWRWASRITGHWLKYGAPPDVRSHTRPGPELARCIAELGALPIQRILVAHSDPIEDRPAEQLREAWRFAAP
ncbi:MAG: DUF4336 domain-containing protein [Deltaproteobacteria bacterium]|nr:DUF4336 domain-containing protein [Deltaproteobacteria bacterium]